MSKEELMAEIYRLDQSYVRLKIDLSKYTVEELQKHYDRKKNAPISRYAYNRNTTVRKVPATPRTDGFQEVSPSSTAEDTNANTGVSFSGFDALKKG